MTKVEKRRIIAALTKAINAAGDVQLEWSRDAIYAGAGLIPGGFETFVPSLIVFATLKLIPPVAKVKRRAMA